MNNRGSVTVFTTIALTALVIMLVAFIQMSKKIAVNSAIDSIEQVAATSILAEYDRELYDKYKLFGYYGNEKMVNDKVYGYLEGSFDSKNYIKWQGVESVVYDYSLGNSDVFKKQIIDEGKLLIAKSIFDHAHVAQSVKNNSKVGNKISRKIQNEEILGDLPSKNYTGHLSISSIAGRIKKLSSFRDLIKTSSNDYIISRYINVFYKNYCSTEDERNTYFSNEQEYIICGKPNDQENEAIVKYMIVGVRQVLNLAYLNKTPEKTELIDAMAEILTPGPQAAATRELLLSAWAFAESINDYQLLIHGRKVPFVKDETSWATDLDSVVNNRGQGYIDDDDIKGDSYSDYLSGFLYLMDENVKLSRMMDLIQINMKYDYWKDFRIDDMYGGVQLKLVVNDNLHVYSKVY